MRNDDWELLNGWSDDEIDADDRARLSRRMNSDPELNSALADIEDLKQRLGQLSQAPAPQPGPVQRWLPVAVPALAAGIVAVSAVLFLAERQDSPRGVARFHASMSQEDFDDGRGLSSRDAIDLSGSNLALVDVRTVQFDFGAAASWHYRGPNDCALTILSGPVLRIEPGPMAHDWRVGETDYLAVADGMDESRFLAVTRFAESETRKDASSDDLLLAMREETATAESCA